ncbi:hypothetical protein FRX31_010914 [Thalictrum thalictroides]|uniref:Uncharacterized protein n=1 Tax=Thalictrum thalictroides TaxID=46969 RepID=A0A7J6WRC5_THATH|nr:hypothetical protein FRX31_010914 [Thalictrum thalictroides]
MGEELIELKHISIRIREDIHISNENDELLQRIKEKIHPIPSSQCCIYRIPECLRILPEDAYVPKIVSLGPFHRDKEGLKAMEEHKKWDPNHGDCLLEEYVQYFFRDVLPPVELCNQRFISQTNHLLGLLRNHFFQFTKQNEKAEYSYEDQRIGQDEEEEYSYENKRIECATELSNAGMKFVAAHFADSLLDISFNENGVFKFLFSFWMTQSVIFLVI